jgi:phytanoyl-CoA dioxygenase PhyH
VFGQDLFAHFRAFGYVVLRGLFDQREVAELTGEVTRELTAAFGVIGAAPDTGGVSGDYLPLTVDRAPLSQALMADDPRLYQGAAALLDSPVVPTPPIGTCFTSNAGWHTDQGPAIGGLKYLAHLQPRTAADGALRVIPGSHEPGFTARLRAYWRLDPATQGFAGWPVPCVALETAPGDVIAFDEHLWHSSSGGERRLAWTVEYLPWPGLGDPDRLRVTRELITDCADFDVDGWPAWSDWVAGATTPSRKLAVERLRLLGVVDAR